MAFDGLTLIGLGSGDPMQLSRQAWEALLCSKLVFLSAPQVSLRRVLPEDIEFRGIEELAEEGIGLNERSEKIIESLVSHAKRIKNATYVVPGNPLMDDPLAIEIVHRENELGVPIRVIPGVSFLDLVMNSLKLDPQSHIALCDANDLVNKHVPPFPPGAHAIIKRIISPELAVCIRFALNNMFPEEYPVKLFRINEWGMTTEENLHLCDIDAQTFTGEPACIYIPPLDYRKSFEAFHEIVAHLRAPDGCPWDRKQDYQSLRSDLLEETYEALEAIDARDYAHLCEELGDLVLLILMFSQIASENKDFNIFDVLHGIHLKIIRRHPHVFGEIKAQDEHEVTRLWEIVKAEERIANGIPQNSLLDAVSPTLPALAKAQAYQKRAARVGFDWSKLQGVIDKVYEEFDELQTADNDDAFGRELGDLLFSVVNLARWKGIDAESAFREANERFSARFTFIEHKAQELGRSLGEMNLEEMEELWQEAKKRLTSEDDKGHQ